MANLPQAAQQILAMPGVESLEREPDGWCCHLRYGWSTDALDGGGTIIDRNLATIRAYVKNARPWDVEQAAEPETAEPLGPRQIGYARVSTARQDEAAQVQALTDAGCDEVFAERVSTMTPVEQRQQLQAALEALRPGDELVVAKLDRLGRTQVEVINCLNDLQGRGIHVRTLDGLINTQALGKMAPLVVGLLTGLAEVERSLIQERTRESIAYRRATGGDLGGRRRSYSEEQAELVRELAASGRSRRKIQGATGLSQGTIDRILKTAPVADVVAAEQG